MSRKPRIGPRAAGRWAGRHRLAHSRTIAKRKPSVRIARRFSSLSVMRLTAQWRCPAFAGTSGKRRVVGSDYGSACTFITSQLRERTARAQQFRAVLRPSEARRTDKLAHRCWSSEPFASAPARRCRTLAGCRLFTSRALRYEQKTKRSWLGPAVPQPRRSAKTSAGRAARLVANRPRLQLRLYGPRSRRSANAFRPGL